MGTVMMESNGVSNDAPLLSSTCDLTCGGDVWDKEGSMAQGFMEVKRLLDALGF